MNNSLNSLLNLTKTSPFFAVRISKIHCAGILNAWNRNDEIDPKKWLEYNKQIFPPQKPGEEPRPAVSL